MPLNVSERVCMRSFVFAQRTTETHTDTHIQHNTNNNNNNNISSSSSSSNSCSVGEVVFCEIPPPRQKLAAACFVKQCKVFLVAQDTLWQKRGKFVCVFAQETLALLLDNLAEVLLHRCPVLRLAIPLVVLGATAGAALFQQLLDCAAVLCLAHAPLLCVHLLKTLVLGELLHHLLAEFLLLVRLSLRPLALDLHLVLVGLAKGKALTQRLFDARHFLVPLALLLLLHIQLVAHALHLLLLALSALDLAGQLLVDGVLVRVGLLLARLQRRLAAALVVGVPANALILLLNPRGFFLTPVETLCLEFVNVPLCLVLFVEAMLQIFLIFLVDPRHDVVNHLLLAEEVLVCLLPRTLLLLKLTLEDILVRFLLVHPVCLSRLFLLLECAQLSINLAGVFDTLRLLLLNIRLLLCNLHRPLLVHVGAVELHLKRAQFGAVFADHLPNLNLSQLLQLLLLQSFDQTLLLLFFTATLLLLCLRLLNHAVCLNLATLLLLSSQSPQVLNTVVAAHVRPQHVVPVDVLHNVFPSKLAASALLVPPCRMHFPVLIRRRPQQYKARCSTVSTGGMVVL
eukprot:Opistho-2@61576